MSWPLVEIGKLVSKVQTWNPTKSENTDSFNYVDLSSVDKANKVIDSALVPKVLPSEAPSRARQLICHNDVIVATVRPNLNGVALVPKQLHGSTASTGYCVLRPIPEKLCAKYLFYWVQTSSFVSDMMSKATGANYPAVSDKTVKGNKIPLPPLDEQKRIAAILDKADSVRRKRQQAIELADDFLRSVFLNMFGDPVANPKCWELRSMKDLIHIQGGYAFKSGDFEETGVPVVKIGNANKVGFTTKGIAFINPKNPEKLKQYELQAGDLLMSLTGTVGKDDYANVTEVTDEYEKYYLNQRVAKIKVVENSLTKNYLKYFLGEPRIKAEITKNNRGVRQANISNADIYDLNMPLPPRELLEKFDLILSQIQKMQRKTSIVPRINEEFFSSLSQKAFSGEL
ncbi:restriction endonuclease subunit S [Pseudoalteromonas shioyasakiensis]|uniref:restriction endonuclease subunit S n=1 Tax=Pseudoalteromonas shioyasakiensis TaxID=1190813 RepID=UPI000783F60E|nr:restriction endonuclease subunit S [Pseudoalteromonas shioyasakiensis]